MKYNFTISEISKPSAVAFVQTHHYSKVMPRLTKHYLGVHTDGKLVGVLTLGWGTQPLHTIKKLFPNCTSADYYEIGKMCMSPDMPRNSESQMLSAVIGWMRKNTPDKKFLYTWADGIVGKPGYVYQSANFLYGGFIWTDVYIGADGEKIHPRTSKSLCEENAKLLGKPKVFWLTPDFMHSKGIRRIKGKQFRYIMPLNKTAKKELKNSTVNWSIAYPKHSDLQWKQQGKDGKYTLLASMPEFKLDVVNVNAKNVNAHKQNPQSLVDLMGEMC
jgi:hypothetical protein